MGVMGDNWVNGSMGTPVQKFNRRHSLSFNTRLFPDNKIYYSSAFDNFSRRRSYEDKP